MGDATADTAQFCHQKRDVFAGRDQKLFDLIVSRNHVLKFFFFLLDHGHFGLQRFHAQFQLVERDFGKIPASAVIEVSGGEYIPSQENGG